MSGDKTVLIVEDELLVALDLKIELEQRGWSVAGPAPNAEQAFALIQTNGPFTAAILDINLGNETSSDVAVALADAHVPIVFLTGATDTPDFKNAVPTATLQKPAMPTDVFAAIERLLHASQQVRTS